MWAAKISFLKMAVSALSFDVSAYKKFLREHEPELFAGSSPMCCSFADFFEHERSMVPSEEHFEEFPSHPRPGDVYRCGYGIDGETDYLFHDAIVIVQQNRQIALVEGFCGSHDIHVRLVAIADWVREERDLRRLDEATSEGEDKIQEMYDALRQHFDGEAFDLESLYQAWQWESFTISYTLLVPKA